MQISRFARRAAATVAVGALLLLAGPTQAATAARASSEVAGPSVGTVITVSGVVRPGIYNASCRILVPHGGGTVYVLVGGPAIKFGVPVIVRGELNPGIRHACGEGVSLVVLAVSR
jgi:hypothetical protein